MTGTTAFCFTELIFNFRCISLIMALLKNTRIFRHKSIYHTGEICKIFSDIYACCYIPWCTFFPSCCMRITCNFTGRTRILQELLGMQVWTRTLGLVRVDFNSYIWVGCLYEAFDNSGLPCWLIFYACLQSKVEEMIWSHLVMCWCIFYEEGMKPSWFHISWWLLKEDEIIKLESMSLSVSVFRGKV